MRRSLALAGLAVLTACAEAPPPPVVGPPPPPPPAEPEPVADPIGPKPTLAAPQPFTPPAPSVFKTANGITVWLLERHALPLVSVSLSIPYGAASDPKGKAGLAHITADMLDEGAGPRDAVALSTAINDLGASLYTGATIDGTMVALNVLKANWRPAFGIFGDVVARPRFDADEWKRVSGLWKNALQKRAQDPSQVATVVTNAALYGVASPYGHPVDGLLSTASRVDLAAVKAFYKAHVRPDRATLIVVGDVTRAELEAELQASLGRWKAPPGASEPEPLVTATAPSRPRFVLVDRPDAPQSVIAVVREGVAAGDPRAPELDLVNTALGGSFTSRLNQDLREEHGWSYGARSAFTEKRGLGLFLAKASVITDATGKALSAMIADLDKMARLGLTDEEVEKVKAQDRADLVQAYESDGGVAGRLGTLASLGLPPDFDAVASKKRQEAPKAELQKLAAAVSPAGAMIVVVGPRAVLAPALAEAKLPEPELWDPEGFPLPKK